MHMVDLPDAQAARVFAFQEPFYRAGVYGDVLARRWRNALGRTMGTTPPSPAMTGASWSSVAASRAWRRPARPWRRRSGAGSASPATATAFILRGPLLSDDGAAWLGSALLVQLGDRAAVEAMLAGAPYVQAGLYASVEIHDWQFGGRHQG